MENVFSTNIIEVCDYNQFYIFKVSVFSVFIDFWSREVTAAVVSQRSCITPKMFGVYLGTGEG